MVFHPFWNTFHSTSQRPNHSSKLKCPLLSEGLPKLQDKSYCSAALAPGHTAITALIAVDCYCLSNVKQVTEQVLCADTVLGAGKTTMNKTDKLLALVEFRI